MNEALAGIYDSRGEGVCRENQMSLKETRPIPFRSRVRGEVLGCAIKKTQTVRRGIGKKT